MLHTGKRVTAVHFEDADNEDLGINEALLIFFYTQIYTQTILHT